MLDRTVPRSFRWAAICLAIGLIGGACRVESTSPDAASPDASATPEALVSLEHWADADAPLSLRSFDNATYVVERAGKIWRYEDDGRTLILDISDEVVVGHERGMFDLVFSPDGRYAYVSFTGTEEPYGDIHIREYGWTGTEVEGEPREVLVVDNPYPHHNGGQLQFGPDDYLYISLGDGGTATLNQEPDNGDPHDHGQRTDVLLGKLLRIDPRPGPAGEYTIPEDNPFVGAEGRDEIWARGLRNPWRFSFDRETGDLWLPDVGHRFQEEINFQPAGTPGGQNYGWSLLEANLEYKGDPPPDHDEPAYTYPHRDGYCAIIGGQVYRGTKIPDLVGWYVFGDFCTGGLQALRLDDGEGVVRDLGGEIPQLTSLSEGAGGELFALSHSDGVFQVVPLP